MNDTKPLPEQTPVRLTAGKYAGWTGVVEGYWYRFYRVRLTKDMHGEPLATDYLVSPVTRSEMEAL